MDLENKEILNETNLDAYSLKILLQNLENDTLKTSENLTNLLTNAQTSLTNASKIAVNSMQVYRDATENSCKEVENSITIVQEFVTKCQLLNDELKAVDSLAFEVKKIRKTLTLLENATNKIVKSFEG
eukprot:TRINITY_DN306_c1_g2_i3.p1 TRINITY_DN306_c1_g2~~TRINITY_DN306_c1_g2_i3.p1  ORF type:complete len:128 (-),score=55.04 TRINITY_DN306_c1_g2_i3:36-419(-)